MEIGVRVVVVSSCDFLEALELCLDNCFFNSACNGTTATGTGVAGVVASITDEDDDDGISASSAIFFFGLSSTVTTSTFVDEWSSSDFCFGTTTTSDLSDFKEICFTGSTL